MWIDPAGEPVVVAMTQYVPYDGDFLDRVQTLVYQAIVDAPAQERDPVQ